MFQTALAVAPGRLFRPMGVAAALLLVAPTVHAQAQTQPQGQAPVAASPASSSAQTAIERAAKARKYLFVYFYKEGGSLAGALLGKGKSDSLRPVFDAAMAKVANRADSVAVNISDPAEKDIVQRYDVSRAPMPLVLAMAPNGAITAGFPGRFDEPQLLDAFASPAMEKCLKSLQNRRLVFLCVQNDKTKNNAPAMAGVEQFKADARFSKATDIVKVDPADKAEAKLLGQFKVPTDSSEATTVLLAPPGAPIVTVTGATDKNMLVAKLTAAVSSCGAGCGPSGCGPKK